MRRAFQSKDKHASVFPLMHSISIRSWTEPFPSYEGVAVVFDIFRCTTTAHCLYSRVPQKLFVGQSLKELREQNVSSVKQAQVFSELSQAIECVERFDNSPHFAMHAPLNEGASTLLATTTGTPAMFAARHFRKVFLGSFTNFSALMAVLAKLDEPITLIPAAIPDWKHIEDEAAAQAVATCLDGYIDIPKFVRACAESASENIRKSNRVPELVKKLPKGLEDTDISLSLDIFPFVLALDFANAPHPLMARVEEYK